MERSERDSATVVAAGPRPAMGPADRPGASAGPPPAGAPRRGGRAPGSTPAPEPPAGSRGGDLPPDGPVVVVRDRRRDGKRWPALNFRVRGGSRASGKWRHCATSEREGRRTGSERYAPATFLSRRTAHHGSVRARGRTNGTGGVNETTRSSIRSRARARGGGTSRKSVHAKRLARGGVDEDHDGRIVITRFDGQVDPWERRSARENSPRRTSTSLNPRERLPEVRSRGLSDVLDGYPAISRAVAPALGATRG